MLPGTSALAICISGTILEDQPVLHDEFPKEVGDNGAGWEYVGMNWARRSLGAKAFVTDLKASGSIDGAFVFNVAVRFGLPPKKDTDGLIGAVQEPLELSPGRPDLAPENKQEFAESSGA